MPRAVVLHPDPVLRAVAVPVTRFDEGLARLAEEMLDTMYAAPGRGLAAPQVGVSQRLFVMDATWKDGPRRPCVFVNPEIVAGEGRVTGPEACLSIPGRTVQVERDAAVTVRWQDLGGAAHEARFDGFEAICIQHETDHLDGVLCIDREAEA